MKKMFLTLSTLAIISCGSQFEEGRKVDDVIDPGAITVKKI